MSIIQTESFKKGIVLSTLFNFGAKGLSFLNNIIIAYYFGTQISTDLYFYSIGIIIFIAYLINGISTSVLIPESMRIREKYGTRESQKFLNFFLYIFLFICFFLISILLFSPSFFFSVFSKYSSLLLAEYQTVLILAILLLPFTCINSFLLDILASYRYFTLPMFFSVVTSLLSIVSIVFFHDILKTGSILIGLITANMLNVIILFLLMKIKFSWTKSVSYLNINKKIVTNIFYSETGNISTALAGYVPLYVISGFSTGMVTALNYGRQVADLLNILFTNQICAVSGIKLNELYSKKEFKLFNDTFIRTSEFLTFLLLPLSFIVAIYSQNIISLLFQRGAFNTTSVLQSALFLKYFALSTCLIGSDLISTRAILASQKLKYAFWVQISMNIIQIVSLFALKPFLHEIAIPLSILIKYLVNFFILWLLFHYILPFLTYSRIIINFIKLVFVNLVISLVVIMSMNRFAFHNPLIILTIATCIYFSLLCIITLYFKLNEEMNNILHKLARTLLIHLRKKFY